VTLLLGVAGDLAAAWVDQQRVGPFTCYAEFPMAEIQPLLMEVQQLPADLARALGIRPVEEAIELYLFRSKGTYDQFLSRHLPKIAYRRALYVKDRGPGRVFAYRGPNFDVDLRHESTHALLHATLPMVPLWLDEGLAVYFENAPNKRENGSPQREAVRWSLRLGALERLDGLERKRGIEEMDRGDYRAAWAWVHFMLHGPPEAKDELARFVSDLQSSNPPGLLSQRLRQRVENPAAQLAAHFKIWSR